MRIIDPADYRDQPWRGTSPWGQVQRACELAPGIHQLSTASHGGVWLSSSRVVALKKAFPGFAPFAGWPWLEEDCDACLIPLAWPEVVSASAVREAVRMVQGMAEWKHCANKWGPVRDQIRPDVLDIAAAEERRLVAADAWEYCGLSSGDFRAPYHQCWAVSLRRVRDGSITTRLMPYPNSREFTTTQLALFPEYVPDLHDMARDEIAARARQRQGVCQ